MKTILLILMLLVVSGCNETNFLTSPETQTNDAYPDRVLLVTITITDQSEAIQFGTQTLLWEDVPLEYGYSCGYIPESFSPVKITITARWGERKNTGFKILRQTDSGYNDLLMQKTMDNSDIETVVFSKPLISNHVSLLLDTYHTKK